MTNGGVTLVDIVAFGFAAFALAPLLARLGWRWYAAASTIATIAIGIAWFGSDVATRPLVAWLAGDAGLVLVGGGLTVMARLVDGDDASVVFHFLVALVVGGVVAGALVDHLRQSRERGYAPAGIALQQAVALPRAVSPACGAAVWRTDDAATAGTPARAARIDYGAWRAMPSTLALEAASPSTSRRWFRGLSCGALDRDLQRRIVEATQAHDGWVAGEGPQGVMLLPSLGLYVHAWALRD